MYVIGKSTINDRARLAVDSSSIYEQKDYYYRAKSWVAYLVACWKLGELSDSEISEWKLKAIKGELNENL